VLVSFATRDGHIYERLCDEIDAHDQPRYAADAIITGSHVDSVSRDMTTVAGISAPVGTSVVDPYRPRS